ncbi:Secreted protein OS=Streptomyces alboniger OX=132473 GN=CP975_06425 PE=4 SV=1 [Streptomyces alboniger]
MQQSAVPELAHTHTRPIHWVATATAVAGVVALSSILQPNPATAAQSADPRTKSAPAVIAPPDPADVDFPIECGPVKALVVKKATGDLDGDGRPETVAVVHCDAPMGTPPDGVYVLTRSADTGRPRVVATLVNPKDRKTVTDFALRDHAVVATLLGYSTADVPSCCPDVKDSAKWRWKNGAFVRSTPAGSHTV